MRSFRQLLCVLLAATQMPAATTVSWEMSTYQDFLKGRFSGIALTRDGRLQLAPEVRTLFASDQPAIWAVAKAPSGTLYLGTGHKGRVVEIPRGGTPKTLFTAPEPEIFALTVGQDGAVYAGTSPNGKVYRIENGKATEYFVPKEQYIWSLAFGTDRALYVGTGDQGKVYRVAEAGKGEVYYETGQAHVTVLAMDPKGQVLAGTEPNGILYRISARDKAFVLYDSNLPEIRSIANGPDGSLYVAALGGSVGQRTSAATTAASPASTPLVAPTTTITVTEDPSPTGEAAPRQSGIDVKAQAEAPKPSAPAVPVPTAPAVELFGVEKSALYRIFPDNRVETLWSSKEENAYDLLLKGNDVYVATDEQGRIYRLGVDRKPSLIAQTNEGEMTRLLEIENGIVASTGSTGKLLALVDSQAGVAGDYESPVHDSSSVARWGVLAWKAMGDAQASRAIRFRTRSGNSARPDRTWSEWSEPMTNPDGAQIKSPNARFIQWKAEFPPSAKASLLDSVSVSYLPQNNPPAIRSLNVTTFTTGTAAPKVAAPAASSAGTYSVTVTDTGDASASTPAGTPTQNIGRSVVQQLFINWTADDPDGDRLLYSLYYRAEDERDWKMLRTNFADLSMTIDSDIFADGRYLFRLTASDKLMNAPPMAHEAEWVSAPVLFDNTPPAVSAGPARKTGAEAEIVFEAKDASSPIRRAEYSLDAGTWAPIDPEDGVLDSLRERFSLKLSALAAKEHVVVLRVYDGAGNAGLAKVVIPQ
jgi:hypothetical protein